MAQSIDFQCDDWQQSVLRSGADRLLLLAPRQSGKSAIFGLKCLHQMIYFPGSVCLLVSRSTRQSTELLRKVRLYHAALDDAPPLLGNAQSYIEMANGSRVMALPASESTIRTFSCDLLLLDEAARIPDGLYLAVRPMLATTKGALWAASTPCGRRGFYYECWSGAGEWQRVRVAVDQCPRLTPEFLAQEQAELPPVWFQQEYLTDFVALETALFSIEDIDRAFDPRVPERKLEW
jgi:hypothetical protein